MSRQIQNYNLKNMISNNSLSKGVLFLFFLFFAFIGNSATYYINDNSFIGDVWCTGLGNNSNSGSKASPYLTLKYVIQNVAKSGDIIYIDAGTYNDKQISESILKESNITIIGAGPTKTKIINSGGSFGVYFMRIYNVNNITLKNFQVQGYINTTSYEGEAITINNAKNIVFENIVFAKSNGGSGEAAVIINDESTVSFDKISFVCQTQATNGGGIDIKKGGGGTPHNVTVTIDNSMISYNNRSGGFSGTNGGGMIIEGDATVNVTINNSSISENSARSGGGIYMTGGILNMNNCCIANNTSTTTDPDFGGGIWFAGTSGLCTLTNCSFTNNTINSARGGGIGLSSQIKNVNVALVDCDFSGNNASLGKDICTRNVSSRTVNLTANNCTFGSGGTVINNISGTISLTNCGTPSTTGTVSNNNGVRVGTTVTNCPLFGGSCPEIVICNPAKPGPNVTVTCPSTTAKLTATGPSGSVFYWFDVATGGIVLDTSSTATPDFDITGVTASKTYYVVSSLDGCETRVPITVTYVDCPTCPTISYPSASYCQVGKANPTINPSATGTFSGSSTDLVIDPSTGEIDLVNSKPGTYTIKCVITAGVCEPTTTITINPNGNPNTDVTGLTPICAGQNAVFTITGTKDEIITYTGVSGAPVSPVTLDATGTATVTVSNAQTDQIITLGTASSGSCPTTLSNKTFTIKVNPVGDANTNVTGNGPICTGENAIFTITGKPGDIIDYTGVVGVPASPVTIDVTGKVSIIVTSPLVDQIITLNSATNGSCPTPLVGKTATVKVNSKPDKPLFNNVIQPTCTSNGTADVTNYLPSPATYIFNPSSGISIAAPGKISASSGKYKFVVSKDGCTSDSSDLLTMNDVPNKPIIEGPSQVCIGSTITLKAWKDNTKTIKATPNTLNPWVSENGKVTLNPGSDINIKGVTVGTSKITFTDDNNCIAEQTITVNGLPIVPSLSYVAANPLVFAGNLADTVCKGNNVDYNLNGTAGNTVYFKGKISPLSIVIDPSGINKLAISQLLKDTVVILDSISNGSCSIPLSNQLKFVVSDTVLTVKANKTSSCLSSTGSIDVTTSTKGRISWSNSDLSVTGPHTVVAATTYQIPNLKAGTYTITFFNGGCELTRTVTISDPDKPKTPTKIEASGATTFCDGESITLKASVIPVGATINWKKDGVTFGNPNDNPITVTASGTYSVTVTTSGCTSDANDTTIIVNPLPGKPVIDNADLTQKFCKSENAKVSNLKPISGVIWFDVNGTKLSPTDLLTSTDYYAALESDKGCFTKKSDRVKVTVIIKENPADPAVTSPQTFCKVDNKSVADLNPKSSGTIEIRWYLGTTLQLPANNLQKGTYYVESYQDGCSSLNKKTVEVDVIDVPTPDQPTGKLCANNQASLTLADVYKGVSNYYFYDLLNASVLPSKIIANGDKYIVKQSLNGCLSQGITITISILNGPSLSSNPYTLTPSLCEVDKPTFDIVEAKYSSLPTSGGTIYWYQAQASSLTNSLDKSTQIASGSYWIAVKDVDGCYSKKQEVKLTVDPGIKPTLKPIELCSTSEYKVVDLNVANISNPAGILTWYYAKGGNNVAENNLAVSKDPIVQYWASYKKTASECEGEMVKLDLTWIQFNQDLNLDEKNQKFCKTGSKTVADLNLLPYTSTQVAWFENETAIDALPGSTTLYDETYYAAEYKITTDGKYCVNSQRFPVNVDFYSTKMYPSVKESVCTKQNGSIEFINPPADYVFNWYEVSNISTLDFTGSKYTKPLEKQSFKIVISDSKACKDSITVSMPQCTDSPIPQVLSPNGDNNNDKWVINYASKYKNVQVKIFNRWGNEVYESAIPYTDDWEGKYKNEYLPTGTYYYVIDKGNGEPVETGFIEFVK